MKEQSGIVSYLKEYCDCSGVHGFRYLSENHRNWFERCFWGTTFIVCGILCSIMIFKIKVKVDTTPVIVSFAESPTNVRDIPFPAVTLCPLSKCRQTFFNRSKYAHMIESGIDLYDDYEIWVEHLYNVSCKRVSRLSAYEDHFQLNETIIRDLVNTLYREFVINWMFSNVMSPELESFLKEIVVFTSKQLENTDAGFYNNTVEEMYPDLHELPSFRRSMDQYYPVWKDDIYMKLRALNFVCRANSFNSSSGFNKSSFGYTDAMIFLAKVAEVTSRGYRNSGNGAIFDRSNKFDHVFDDFFAPTLTEEGLCFTFNKLNESQFYRDQVEYHRVPLGNDVDSTSYIVSPISNDWDPDSGYFEERGKLTPHLYPRRAFGVGMDSGLQITLDHQFRDDIDLNCNPGGVTGYKVILHRPDEEPSASLSFAVNVPFYKEVSLAVTTSLLTTSPELKDYHPLRRQCYYSYEKRLDYFKLYSKNNCELECMTKAVLKKCGCVAFYMPRYNSTKICEDPAQNCVVKAIRELEKQEIREDLMHVSEDEDGAFGSSVYTAACDCLPSCFTMFYSAEVSTVDLDYGEHFRAFNSENFFFKDNIVYNFIKIFYKHKQFMSMKRSERYGQIDLFAYSGGVLGLFCGFSMLSLIELIYFVTLRLWINLYWHWKPKSRLEKTEILRSREQVQRLRNETNFLRPVVPRRRAPQRHELADSVLRRTRAMAPVYFVYE